jgi:hypothetical protein
MRDERTKILDMLAAGTVTVEQAVQLLDAVASRAAGGAGGESAAPARGSDAAPRFTVEELVQLADHGVGADFLRAVREAGYHDLSADELTELADHGVSAGYLEELRHVGLIDLTVDAVIELFDHGVSPAYVRELREAGFANLSVEQVTELSDHGVSLDYLRQIGGARSPAGVGGADASGERSGER